MSMVLCRSPLTSTTTASSPKSRLKRSVASEVSDELRDQGVRAGARLQAQRQRGAGQRQHGHHDHRHQRAARDRAHERGEPIACLSPHAVSLGERPGVRAGAADHSRARARPICGYLPGWPTRRPSGACSRHGGAVGPVGVNTNCWISPGSCAGSSAGRGRHLRRAAGLAQVGAEHRQAAGDLVVGARLGVGVRAVGGDAPCVGGQDLGVQRVGGAQVLSAGANRRSLAARPCRWRRTPRSRACTGPGSRGSAGSRAGRARAGPAAAWCRRGCPRARAGPGARRGSAGRGRGAAPSRSGATFARLTSVGDNWRAAGRSWVTSGSVSAAKREQPARGGARLAQEGREATNVSASWRSRLAVVSNTRLELLISAAQLALALAERVEHRAGVAHQAARGLLLLVEDLEHVVHVLGERREGGQRVVQRPGRRRRRPGPARRARSENARAGLGVEGRGRSRRARPWATPAPAGRRTAVRAASSPSRSPGLSST